MVSTLETMDSLAGKFATDPKSDLYLIRGSDSITRLLRWPSLFGILKYLVLVVVRPGSHPWKEFGNAPAFRLNHNRFLILRRTYEDGLSSTLIRRRLSQGLSSRFLVPDPVAQYIQENGLYRES